MLCRRLSPQVAPPPGGDDAVDVPLELSVALREGGQHLLRGHALCGGDVDVVAADHELIAAAAVGSANRHDLAAPVRDQKFAPAAAASWVK